MADREEVEEMLLKMRQCEEEIGKAIIGQREVVHEIMLAILADGNVLLEGVPGLGKTQLVKTISRVLSLSFSRIQFTPDLMPADVTGTNIIVRENDNNVFRFEEGPVFANIVLADEINRATPKTQAAMLEAMQEKTVTVGKHTYKLPSPYIVLATQNPIENEGTYPLPEAQLDRFIFKINMDFPTLDELKSIMDITVTNKKVELDKILNEEYIIRMRELIRDIPMADAVQEYALKIVIGTHPELPGASDEVKKYLSAGASPRAAQAIFLTAKAKAFLDGRYNVSFEDVESVALPALRHRVIPGFEAVSDGISVDDILIKMISKVEK
ncbi:MAG: MoxR family ATPase [Lachnospiraceae bacterium]|nr:MoxR family ATPase [Lachnospiraceae bacterium]MBQ2320035.1 MoxR family ATPase [Lachnospiraceae bacterium]